MRKEKKKSRITVSIKHKEFLEDVSFDEKRRQRHLAKHRAWLNAQTLGNALSLAYPMMMFAMVLRPRDGILCGPRGALHLLLRRAVLCLRQFYSAWESWQIWSFNFLPVVCVFLLLNFCFTNKLIKYSNIISIQFSLGDGERKGDDPTWQMLSFCLMRSRQVLKYHSSGLVTATY